MMEIAPLMMSSEILGPACVAQAQTPTELHAAFEIRHRVFVVEQHVALDLERDEDDSLATHFLATVQGVPVGTARLVSKGGGRAKVGRVAVLASARGLGIGRALMEAIHQLGVPPLKGAAGGVGEPITGARELYLDAQVQVIPFYESLGYVCEGDEFEDCGILHRRMTRCLA